MTSGNSLDYTAEDMARMVQHEAAVKVHAFARCACMPLPVYWAAAAAAAWLLAFALAAGGQRRAWQAGWLCALCALRGKRAPL